MGELISLSQRLADRSRGPGAMQGSLAFFFAPGCPVSYLIAERIERTLGEVEWIPVPPLGVTGEELIMSARIQARGLRLPLEMPENPAADPRPLTRVACLAAEQGIGARFGLAAARLIFCGGYEIDDPQLVAEAADVAGLVRRDAARAAAGDRFDPALEATAAGLRRHGATGTPVVRVGRRWFHGLQALPGAAILGALSELSGAGSQPV